MPGQLHSTCFAKFIRACQSLLGFHGLVNQSAAKAMLRSEMRNLLAAIPGDQINSASRRICQCIAGSKDLLHNVKTIAVYAATGYEVSLSSLHELLPGTLLAYPRCHPHQQLSFHHVGNPIELVPGKLDIPEPVPGMHEQVELADIDLILCPGLAFSLDGSRLGRGGGYYDRALEAFTGRICGVALSQQIKSSVPRDDHDALMHYLACESGVQLTRLR